MDVLFSLIRSKLNNFIKLDDGDINEIISISTIKDFEKGELIDQQGVRAQNVYFILSGLMRSFYTSDEGKEHNQAFKVENEFMACFSSLLRGNESLVSIDCLENTKVVVIPFAQLEELYERNFSICKVGKKIAEQHFLNKEKRESYFLLYSAKERYLKFSEERPDLIERVPQLHLASFLGVTATSFNRILKDLKES